MPLPPKYASASSPPPQKKKVRPNFLGPLEKGCPKYFCLHTIHIPPTQTKIKYANLHLYLMSLYFLINLSGTSLPSPPLPSPPLPLLAMYTVDNSEWDHFVKLKMRIWSMFFPAWATPLYHGNHPPLHVVRYVREGHFFHSIHTYVLQRDILVFEENSGDVYRASFQAVRIEYIYRGVFTPWCWNRGVPLYTHSRVLE